MTIEVVREAADVLLADGTIATVREATTADHDALLELHARVSDESLRLRFFATARDAGRTYAEHLAAGDGSALVLVAESRGSLLGVASAEIDPQCPEEAEVAFLVADDAHGRGVGTLLLEHLVDAARLRRIRRFTADVLVENQAMLAVFADAGFPAAKHVADGVVTWEIATGPSEDALLAADHRESTAERRSLRPMLYPRSVAVAGVRREGGGIGHAVLTSILRGSFTGDLWVIHPAAEHVIGVPACRDLASVPGHIDVLVVAVPASEVVELVADAATRGVSTVVVISSGFSELGAAGAHVQRAILRLAREHDMRVLGPNCLGLLCNDPAIRLNATFSSSVPRAGGLAVGSQSGGVGIALLDLARDRGLGVHSFLSLGNQSDISGTDLLAAWYDDPKVTAGALYLEELGQPWKFARVARRFSERKPLLAVVGGRSQGGARGGASHTASTATPAVAVDALFSQAGVIRCSSAAELTRTADLLSSQPLPRGSRVGIVSNAGGIGILAADAADAVGLQVPQLSPGTQAEIARHVTGTIGVGNPVDLGAGAGAEAVQGAVGALLRTGEVDAVLVAIVATSVADARPAVVAVDEVTRKARSEGCSAPVLLVTMGGLDPDPTSVDAVTLFDNPEDAAQSLALAWRYADWRATARDPWVPRDEARADTARDLAAQLARDGSARWLEPADIDGLLGSYGISTYGRTVRGADAAAAAANELGFPVAVKVAAPEVVHKTDRGLVRLGLTTSTQVADAVGSFGAELSSPDVAVLVQPERSGVELALGLTRHPTFGPLVMVAAGGVRTDLLDDRAFLVPPLTRRDANRALRSLRIWPALVGYRGAEPVDVGALEDLVLQLGQIARELPEVTELDLNPALATPEGAVLVDVKVRIAPAPPRSSSPPRQLTPVAVGQSDDDPSTLDLGTNDSRT
ncbi:MAG: GNAT family N-acetyltransferase [Marmoricola sp.]